MILPAAEDVAAQGLPAAPLVTLEPGCGGAVIKNTIPETVTFHLRNFVPNSSVTISWGSTQQQVVTVGPYGAFDPQFTFDRGFGEVSVSAFDTNNPRVGALATFRVPCEPFIRLTPSCDAPADPNLPRPIAITVDGFNWDPFFGGVGVALLARDAVGTESVISEIETGAPNDFGGFQVVLDQTPSGRILGGPLMALPAGEYVVAAIQGQREMRVDTDFAVPCPELRIQPDCGEAGEPIDIYDVLITGSGWRPNRAVEIIFSADDQPQVFLLNVDLPLSGQLTHPDGSEVRIEPYRRPSGQYVVRARQTLDDIVLREGTAIFTVECVIPLVEATPNCGPPALLGDVERRYAITVAGSDFEPGSVLIVFDALGQTETFAADVLADRSFTRAINPLPRPAGGYEIHAVQQKRDGTATVVPVAFSVPCMPAAPTAIAARCDPEDTTQPDLAQVVVVGDGFFVGPFELAVGVAPIETLATDGAGGFERRLPAIDLPDGPLEIVASQRDANLALVAEARAFISLPCGTPLQPAITISPDSGPPGFVVVVNGYSFEPGAPVIIVWDHGIGRQPILVQADDDGTFVHQVLLFHRDFYGPRNLIATSGDDPVQFEPISVPYVVVPGRGSPPIFSDSPFTGSETIVLRR